MRDTTSAGDSIKRRWATGSSAVRGRATAQALGLTGTEQGLLPGLGTGQGLWRIKNRSFVVQHQLHPAELAMYETGQKARGA